MITKSKILVTCIILLGTIFTLSKFNFGNEKSDMVLQVSADKKQEIDVVSTSAYKQEYEIVEQTIADSNTSGIEVRDYNGNGVSWLINKVSDAQESRESFKVINTYDQFGHKISTVEVPGSRKIAEGSPEIHQYGGYAQPGSYFRPAQITRYGYDCAGCSVRPDDYSGTAMGIHVGDNRVKQSNGVWQEGITYDGYYIIATGPAIPLGSIVEISGHGFSGMGLSPNVPFKAIVGDRGVSGSAIDLFIGSESKLSRVGQSYGSNTVVKILH